MPSLPWHSDSSRVMSSTWSFENACAFLDSRRRVPCSVASRFLPPHVVDTAPRETRPHCSILRATSHLLGTEFPPASSRRHAPSRAIRTLLNSPRPCQTILSKTSLDPIRMAQCPALCLHEIRCLLSRRCLGTALEMQLQDLFERVRWAKSQPVADLSRMRLLHGAHTPTHTHTHNTRERVPWTH